MKILKSITAVAITAAAALTATAGVAHATGSGCDTNPITSGPAQGWTLTACVNGQGGDSFAYSWYASAPSSSTDVRVWWNLSCQTRWGGTVVKNAGSAHEYGGGQGDGIGWSLQWPYDCTWKVWITESNNWQGEVDEYWYAP